MTRSLTALILANAIPLVGVIFLGWDATVVLSLYWLETLVVGVFGVLRILTSQGGGPGPSKLFLAPFFVVHFGLFMFVHGVFLSVMLGIGESSTGISGGLGHNSPFDLANTLLQNLWGQQSAWIGFGALGVSHGLSFATNFIGAGEYRDANPQKMMFLPYRRVIIMHVTVLFGGAATVFLGQPVALLLLLVLAKTAVDIRAHRREHFVLSAP